MYTVSKTEPGLTHGTAHPSSSKIHASLEVAKGYHVGYIKAKINLDWSNSFWRTFSTTVNVNYGFGM